MKQYILYDSRAAGGLGTDDASVLVACESEAEAKSYKGEFGGMSCYSYDIVDSKLVNEKWEWDWFPQSRQKRGKR
jgi:hypothetical protein